MPKTATPAKAKVKVDPQFVGLLLFLLGGDVNRENIEDSIAAAVNGAREMLDSDPLVTAFDEHANRASIYGIVSRAVEHGLAAPDALCGAEKQQALKVLRAVNNDSGVLCIEDHSMGYAVLLQYAEEGMLLGAALMYELLKGGRV